MNETRNNNSKRSSIGCNAKNCSYYGEGYVCNAEHIDVSGKVAQTTGETCCNTFKPKSS